MPGQRLAQLRRGEGTVAGRPWITQPTTRASSPDPYPLAVIASDSARSSTVPAAQVCPGSAATACPVLAGPRGRRRPAAGNQHVGVERPGQRLVEPAGVQPGRTRADRLDDDDIGLVVDRLPGGDDRLQHGVEPALAELLLQFGGGRPDPGGAARYGRDQRGRAVRAAVGPGLGHRLDEADVHAPPVEGPHQPEARPGQVDVCRGGHDQQGSGHDVILVARAEKPGQPPAMTRAVSRAIRSSSLVGTTSARTGPANADAAPGVPAVVRIGLSVLSQAEESQAAEHQATDDGAVLPDAAGEDQRVEPLQPDHQPGDRLATAGARRPRELAAPAHFRQPPRPRWCACRCPLRKAPAARCRLFSALVSSSTVMPVRPAR